jgi:hypothetical protein
MMRMFLDDDDHSQVEFKTLYIDIAKAGWKFRHLTEDGTLSIMDGEGRVEVWQARLPGSGIGNAQWGVNGSHNFGGWEFCRSYETEGSWMIKELVR